MASTCSIRRSSSSRTSQLDLVVAGTAEAVLMVESEADRLPEDVMLGAVVFGHEQMQVAIKAINELKAEAGKPAWNWRRRSPTPRWKPLLPPRRRARWPRLIRSPTS